MERYANMIEFLLQPLLAGFMVAIMSGLLGVFIVWRRMAYYGDTLSHAALLGISLGYLLGFNQQIGVIVVSMLVALTLVWLQASRRLAGDTLLGVLSHSSLSLGLIALSLVEGVRIDLNALLFGDILLVGSADLVLMAAVLVLVLAILTYLWRPLLSLTVHEELARVEGVNVALVTTVYTLLIALTIAVAMKVVGALLITSMLIIPAAAVRHLAQSPFHMAILSAFAGMLAVVAGLAISFQWDTPTGPSIVVSASLLFLLSMFIPIKR